MTFLIAFIISAAWVAGWLYMTYRLDRDFDGLAWFAAPALLVLWPFYAILLVYGLIYTDLSGPK
jgi:hypothetical protein